MCVVSSNAKSVHTHTQCLNECAHHYTESLLQGIYENNGDSMTFFFSTIRTHESHNAWSSSKNSIRGSETPAL